ncbi:hypothetical protein TNCV_3072071 [Trichonephila clavipes]|nr:hypothetical protein TNCV_3072071 [Trichonephila clavipes]
MFDVHRSPIRWMFSGTGIELVPRPATIRYLDHSATATLIAPSSGCCQVTWNPRRRPSGNVIANLGEHKQLGALCNATWDRKLDSAGRPKYSPLLHCKATRGQMAEYPRNQATPTPPRYSWLHPKVLKPQTGPPGEKTPALILCKEKNADKLK